MGYLWPAVIAVGGVGIFSAACLLRCYVFFLPTSRGGSSTKSAAERWKELVNLRTLIHTEALGKIKSDQKKAREELREARLTKDEYEFLYWCFLAKLNGTKAYDDTAPPRFSGLPDCTLDYEEGLNRQ